MTFVYTLLTALALLLLLQVEIRRRVLRANGAFNYLPQNSPIRREGGLGSLQCFDARRLSGANLILLLLCEDDLFFEHHGFNWRELANRIKAFTRGERIAGGSSISQQVVKRLFLQRTSKIIRKLLEVPYTFWLERSYSKDQILSLYLSNIFFGIQIMGLRDAALAYFGKEPQDLTNQEALLLFISIPSPIRSLREICVNRRITQLDFKKAYWKFKDLLRILEVMTQSRGGDNSTFDFAAAKDWMRRYSRFEPTRACSDHAHERISLRSLILVADLVRLARNLPARTPSQVRSCREILPREFREILEAGILHTHSSTPRRSVIAPPNDWGRMIRLASWHGMILPLWECLSRCEIAMPSEAIAPFKLEVERRMVRLTQIQIATDRIADAIQQHGLRVLFIKGLALKQLVGASVTASDPGDIDLLVKHDDFADLHTKLTECGFTPLHRLKPRQCARVLACGEGLTYLNSDDLHVDVHTAIGTPYGDTLSRPDPFEHTSSLPNGVITFSPDYYVTYLALHGLKHRWSRLSWVLGYAMLAERITSAEWEQIFLEAQRRQVYRPILLANFLAQELFEINLGSAMQPYFTRDIVELTGKFIDRYFETQAQRLLHDLVRFSRVFDTRRQSLAYFWTRVTRPGSSDLSNTNGFLQKMFPLIQKGGRFLKIWKTA